MDDYKKKDCLSPIHHELIGKKDSLSLIKKY